MNDETKAADLMSPTGLQELAVIRGMSREELEAACLWLAQQLAVANAHLKRARRKGRRA